MSLKSVWASQVRPCQEREREIEKEKERQREREREREREKSITFHTFFCSL
jgi:hypothetical protein